MDRLGSVLSEKKMVDVGAAPFLRVDEPVSGQSFDADAPVSFRADAEGGVSEVDWRVTDASGVEVRSIPAPVRDGAAIAEASFSAAGEYAVRAVDKAGAAESTEVFFSIRPKDVALAISEPVDGTRVKTGTNMMFIASAKGVSEVVWVVRDEEKGRETNLGKTQVNPQNGHTAKAYTFAPEDGDGLRTIYARDAAGVVEADPVRIELFTEGGLQLIEPADYLRVPFGSNVTLRAEATGAAKDIRWFVDAVGDDNWKQLSAKGNVVSYAPPRIAATDNERLFRVQARASMPGGGSRRTPDRTIVAYCPVLEPRIDLSKKDWDVESPVALKVVSPVGRIGKVVWSFGDGTPDKEGGAIESHAFAKDGTYEVSARVFCADCGAEYAAAPVSVAVCCPDLLPELRIDRDSPDDAEGDPFSRGKPVRMSVAYGAPGAAARAKDVRWNFGDGSAETNLDVVAHPFVEFGERTVSVSVRCAACGRTETAKKTIRIDRKPPKARFRMTRTDSSDKPVGDWIGVPRGRTIALVSTSTGLLKTIC